MAELVLLGLFVIDIVLNLVGFGKLYLCRIRTITEKICIEANFAVIYFMFGNVTLS